LGVEHGMFLLPRIAALVTVWAVVAGARRRWRPGWALSIGAASLAFMALGPARCGQLQSNPPYSSCSSLAGFKFGFRPEPGSFWHNGYEMVTAEAVLLAHAVGGATVMVLVVWVFRRGVAAWRRHRGTSVVTA
jgi:hypothetical protein